MPVSDDKYISDLRQQVNSSFADTYVSKEIGSFVPIRSIPNGK